MHKAPALVYPSTLPSWVQANHRRGGEIRVYTALRDQLEDPWRIFYSRPWLGVMPDGRETDGEADFVVAHPDLGVLVLEVKGGRIGRDATKDRWHTTNAGGDQFTIKNPVAQASTSKHRLLKKLQDLPGWNGRFITVKHGVVFPDCLCPAEDLGPDMPTWLFAGIDEMERLGEWVEERLEQHLPEDIASPDELDDDGIEILTEFFAKSFLLERPIGASLISDDESIRTLTDQQAVILNLLETLTRIAIPGPAGTGKTSLAIEKCRRLAAQGNKTLLTCFNRPLAQQLDRDLAGVQNLRVASFHSLCRSVAERSGTMPSGVSAKTPGYFERLLPEALLRALDANPSEKFDAVVIDEGQDFPENWLAVVEALLKDPSKSSLFVLYDDNQKVYLKAHALANSIPSNGLRLTRILRNAKSIVETIRQLLPKPYSADGPEGMPVTWIESEADLGEKAIEKQIDRLITEEHISSRQIAVLLPDEQYRNQVVRNSFLGKYKVVDAEAEPGNTIVCETVRRFKGLERPVVILVDPERAIGDPETLYVSLTRARLKLVLLAPPGGLAQLRSLLT